MSAPAKSKPAEPAAEEGARAKGGKLKLIVLALLGLVVIGGGGAGAAWFLGFLGGGKEAAAAVEADPNAASADAQGAPDGHGDGAHAATAPPGAEPGHDAPGSGHGEDGHAAAKANGPFFVDLPDVLVNLQSDGRRMRFLKIAVAFEVADESTALAVRQLAPRVLDSFQLYLRTLSVDDLRGAAPVHRMKEELLARVNQAIDPQRVEDVLVKELLVQ
jgi:flagellar FliL protein